MDSKGGARQFGPCHPVPRGGRDDRRVHEAGGHPTQTGGNDGDLGLDVQIYRWSQQSAGVGRGWPTFIGSVSAVMVWPRFMVGGATPGEDLVAGSLGGGRPRLRLRAPLLS